MGSMVSYNSVTFNHKQWCMAYQLIQPMYLFLADFVIVGDHQKKLGGMLYSRTVSSWHLLKHAISLLRHSFIQNCLEASHELFSLHSLAHLSLSLLHTRTHEKKYFRCSGMSLPVVCGNRERYTVTNQIRGRLPRHPASCNTRGLDDSETDIKQRVYVSLY